MGALIRLLGGSGVLMGLVVAGCVGALGPIYDGEDHLVFDEDLLGEWSSEAGNIQRVSVQAYDGEHALAEHLYRIEVTDDDGRVVSLRAGLVDVGNDRLVLDTVALEQEPEVDASPWAILSVMPYHTLNVIELGEDGTFSLRTFRPDEMGTYLQQNPDAVAYHHRPDAVPPEMRSPLLTDEPQAMRAFLAEVPEAVLTDPTLFEPVEEEAS